MKKGYLSEYFEGVAAKRLSAVEVNRLLSNQHEFNGVEPLRQLLGEPTDKVSYAAKLIYLTDTEDELVSEEAVLTWYDARARARFARRVMRWEYRLYFPDTAVSQRAAEGDLLVIAKRRQFGLLVIIAKHGCTVASQLRWLFDLPDVTQPTFVVKTDLSADRDKVNFASRAVLDAIGVESLVEDEQYLEEMLNRFHKKFPPTKQFSAYARETLFEIEPTDDPDRALISWMEREELLFRTLERHLLADRLASGFCGKDSGAVDVEGFLSFSLSVQNRRKSRAGFALENHIETLLINQQIRYVRTPITENNSRPDFLFPGVGEYEDPQFDVFRLTMLGVKSSCKDRWRQVLSEAQRIPRKHLLTLEVAISKNQTDEMRAKNIQLVLPKPLHLSFTSEQQGWLISVSEFLELVRSRQ